MEKITKKEFVYRELLNITPGAMIDTVALSKTTGSTMSYINSICKYAFENEIFCWHETGNYMINGTLPEWPEFKAKITKSYEAYRSTVPSRTDGPRRAYTKKAPKDYKFEENIDNVASIIKVMAKEHTEFKKENAELKDKLKKTIKFARKIKKQRDEFEKAFGDMV